MNIRLILQKDMKNLGKAGDQVLVKKGYARNFLIPQGRAIPLNKDNLRVWKHQKIIIEAKKRKAITERKALIEKLSSVKLKFEKESLKDGRLFGSVTAYDISEALEKLHNISVDKRDISLAVLKTVGNHTVTISLDSEHKTDITVSIKGKITKKTEQEDSRYSKKESASDSSKEKKSASVGDSLEEKKVTSLSSSSEEIKTDSEKSVDSKNTSDDSSEQEEA